MSREFPVNVPASITAKLHNLAMQRRWNYNHLLLRYANERFLYRMSISPYAGKFILKGSSLFIVWQNGDAYRHTMDADLLCFGDASEGCLKNAFAEICSLGDVNSDGMLYSTENMILTPIRVNNEYGGICIVLHAFLGSAKMPLQFDIGIGDAVTPEPEMAAYPVLLNGETPILRIYPKATVVAEKAHAMVSHGEQNSRMKDFSDLYVLAAEFDFDYKVLRQAMLRTFERRGTPVPQGCPSCFTDTFAKSPIKQTQWSAFLRKNALSALPSDFSQVIKFLTAFLLPPLRGYTPAPEIWHSRDSWR